MDVGELPALYNKRNVELKEVRIFFEGLKTKRVSVAISLAPPFYKTSSDGVLGFELAAISGVFDYNSGSTSCPVDKMTGDKWCVETAWDWFQSQTFNDPTPFCQWRVALRNEELSNLLQITGVKLELAWHSQGATGSALSSYAVGEWSDCEECFQTREITCNSVVDGVFQNQFLSFCSYNLGDPQSHYQCCGRCVEEKTDDCTAHPPRLFEWLGGNEADRVPLNFTSVPQTSMLNGAVSLRAGLGWNFLGVALMVAAVK